MTHVMGSYIIAANSFCSRPRGSFTWSDNVRTLHMRHSFDFSLRAKMSQTKGV